MMQELVMWTARNAASVVMVFAAAVLAGCAPYQTYPGPRLPRDQVAVLVCKSAHSGRCRGVIRFTSLNGTDIPNRAEGMEILPGVHYASVVVTWSNGFTETAVLGFSACAGRTYNAQAYEGRPGEDLSKANCRPIGTGEYLADALTVGMLKSSAEQVEAFGMLAAAPVIIPMNLIKKPTPPPTTRPAGPCFVWVWDLESWAVVGGTCPRPRQSASGCDE
jgi:hypothetical protein